MSDVLISIIMPIYNAVDYVEAAIQSVIEQDFEDYELILIDDGSTDGSEDICKKYNSINDKVYYWRQNNRGICNARNQGIKLARGKYIGFADHDDIYQKKYLNRMYEKIVLNPEAEIIRCGVSFVEELPNGKINRHIEKMPEKEWSIEELVDKLVCLPSSFFTVWNCLYKKNFIVENKLFFPEIMKYGQEDYFFNLNAMKYMKKEFFVMEELYTHYRRVGQSTSANFHKDVIECMAINMKQELMLLNKYYKENGKKWIAYARKITGILFYCFRSCDFPEKKSIEMMTYFSTIVENDCFNEKLNAKALKDIFSVSKKYFLIAIAIYYKKWCALAGIYSIRNRTRMS